MSADDKQEINFSRVYNLELPEQHTRDDGGCGCGPAAAREPHLLWVDAGEVELVHAKCGKPPQWWVAGSFGDCLSMDNIEVTVTNEMVCSCNFMEQSVCDCSPDFVARPTGQPSLPQMLRDEADVIKLACPEHGDREGTSYQRCHCEIADDMRRRAHMILEMGTQRPEPPRE